MKCSSFIAPGGRMAPLFAMKVDLPNVFSLIRVFRCSNLILPGSIMLNVCVLVLKEQLGMDFKQFS